DVGAALAGQRFIELARALFASFERGNGTLQLALNILRCALYVLGRLVAASANRSNPGASILAGAHGAVAQVFQRALGLAYACLNTGGVRADLDFCIEVVRHSGL